jgi:hypothetical protein
MFAINVGYAMKLSALNEDAVRVSEDEDAFDKGGEDASSSSFIGFMV